MNRTYLFIAATALCASAVAAVIYMNPSANWSRPSSDRRDVIGEAISKSKDLILPLTPAAATSTPDNVDDSPEPLMPTTSPAENFGQPIGLAATAGKEFAFDLYARLATSPEGAGKNLFFSPYSVSSVLIMAAEGARGETAEEMGKALHFPKKLHRDGPDAAENPWDLEAFHKDMAAVNQSLSGVDRTTRREMRNRLAMLRRELAVLSSPPPPPPPSAPKPGDENGSITINTDPASSEPDDKTLARESELMQQINELNPQIDPYELNVANALWVEKSCSLQKPYLDVINRFDQSGGAFPVDFRNDSIGAANQINEWAKQRTKGRITQIVPADAVAPKTSLVLTDAVYFKGEWFKPFIETGDASFLAAKEDVRVSMMHEDLMQWARYGAFNADGSWFQTPATIPESKVASADNVHDTSLYPGPGGATVLEMPYKGGRLSMVVILPQGENGLANVEKGLSAARFDDWTSNLVSRDVHVFFPKFRLETNYEMGAALKAMGINRAFADPRQPDGAQFEGMCAGEDPDRKVYIAGVLHKAFVEVNEKGTEAAAVTSEVLDGPVGVEVGERAIPFIPTFRANRPFIFAIRDSKTGTILFLGRVVDPRS